MLTAAETGSASRWVETAHGRMHLVDDGAGEVILFVHGTPTWSFEWRHVIGALRGEYRCVAPDHLGFGLSERPREFAYTPEAHAEQLEQLLDLLGLERFTLVVHDFGGPIALPLALARPERITRLVLANTWMWSLRDDPGIRRAARVVNGTLGRWLYRYANLSLRVLLPKAWGDRRRLTREAHRAYLDRFPDADGRERVLWTLARSLTGSSAFFDAQWERRAALANIPTLLVWGMKDPALPPDFLARWREALPHAQVVELADAGHWPHEEEPEAFTAALTRFLRATSAATL